jgi:RNA polymerase sigma factor (sigma-70 family)
LDPFDELLDWLDRDREAAAQKYEIIRAGLIRVFIFNGFCDAEDLADVTINRVMRRLPTIKEGYVGEPIRYFYGVSRYVIRESNRRKEVATDAFAVAAEMKETGSEADCLEKCLKLLSPQQRELILEYYLYDGTDKIRHREKLAKRLGISLRNLRVRAHRIRATLQKCVLNRLHGESDEMQRDVPRMIIGNRRDQQL